MNFLLACLDKNQRKHCSHLSDGKCILKNWRYRKNCEYYIFEVLAEKRSQRVKEIFIINNFNSGKCNQLETVQSIQHVHPFCILQKFNVHWNAVVPGEMQELIITNITTNSAVLSWKYPSELIDLPRCKLILYWLEMKTMVNRFNLIFVPFPSVTVLDQIQIRIRYGMENHIARSDEFDQF